MIKRLFKIICIEDDIQKIHINKLLNIDSNYILNNKEINKLFSQKINLLIDILDYFVAEDKVKNVFYATLSDYINKINEIKEYIKFNKNIIIPFIIYTSKLLEEAYTLSDDYNGYEGSYKGLTRHYVGPGTNIINNDMIQPI
jgi:hypothetical protein